MQEKPGQYLRNMSYAVVAGQSGCYTAVIVMGALILGLWLDATLDTRPVFTLLLTLTSIPVSLFMMVYTVLSMTKRMSPPKVKESKKTNFYDDAGQA